MKQYNFSEPEGGDQSQGWALLSVTWAFVLCATITTLLRVWVRARLTRNMGADDWTIVAALFTTIVGAGIVTALVFVGGLGRHSYYLTSAQRRNFAALGWGDWIQTFITLALMKISICLFLLRLVERKIFRQFLWGLIGFLVLFTAVCAFFFIGVCRPLKAYWNVDAPKNTVCLSDLQLMNVVIAQGTLSVLTDLICAAFPIFFLRKVNLKLRTKIALCALMGLGVITAACCTVRTALSGAMTSPDITWDISANVAWRLPEVNIGIVCANAPTLRPLYLFLRGRLDTQRTKGSSSYASWPSKGGRGDKGALPPNVMWGKSGAQSATLQGSEGDSAFGSRTWAKGGGGGGTLGSLGSGTAADEGVELELGLPVDNKGGKEFRISGRKEVWA